MELSYSLFPGFTTLLHMIIDKERLLNEVFELSQQKIPELKVNNGWELPVLMNRANKTPFHLASDS
jgi:predicted PolB exonuclease-like 3'-5' exonuclease